MSYCRLHSPSSRIAILIINKAANLHELTSARNTTINQMPLCNSHMKELPQQYFRFIFHLFTEILKQMKCDHKLKVYLNISNSMNDWQFDISCNLHVYVSTESKVNPWRSKKKMGLTVTRQTSHICSAWHSTDITHDTMNDTGDTPGYRYL